MVSVFNFAVGKELLIGRTMNSNAHWIGGRLYKMGGMLDRVLTVTDSLDAISGGLVELLSHDPDFIVVVGGLGPTPDDMTLKGVALGLGRRLNPSKEAMRLMREHVEGTGRVFELTPARRKMAMLPEGSVPLKNGVGTAPGVRLTAGKGTVVFCLPGVPREMRDIFLRFAEDEIRGKLGVVHISKATLKLTGVFESAFASSVGDALKMHPEAYIKSHPKGIRGGVPSLELDLTVTSPAKEVAVSTYSELLAFLTRRIADLGGRVVSKRESSR
ncbi:MAG: competence damage-inducible protein A [Nitrososphaerota archaeon]|nr:competence damage-inducible protein A [Nitrososphaerota archaeon]